MEESLLKIQLDVKLRNELFKTAETTETLKLLFSGESNVARVLNGDLNYLVNNINRSIVALESLRETLCLIEKVGD